MPMGSGHSLGFPRLLRGSFVGVFPQNPLRHKQKVLAGLALNFFAKPQRSSGTVSPATCLAGAAASLLAAPPRGHVPGMHAAWGPCVVVQAPWVARCPCARGTHRLGCPCPGARSPACKPSAPSHEGRAAASAGALPSAGEGNWDAVVGGWAGASLESAGWELNQAGCS